MATEMEERVRKIFREDSSPFRIDSYMQRGAIVMEYGFGICQQGSIDLLKRHHRAGPLLELGAGSGYWAYELRKAGVDVIATDGRDGTEFRRSWGDVETLTAREALKKYPRMNALLVWPSDVNEESGWSDEALDYFQGD